MKNCATKKPIKIKPRFDSLILAAVTDALQMLTGAQVQRLHVSDDRQIMLSVYSAQNGERQWLFDLRPQSARTHLVSFKPPRKTQNPPAFEQALRKYILNATITSISQRSFDRVLDIKLEGPQGKVLLTAEIMGPRSNLILCDQNGVVLHAAKLIPAKKEGQREILPGRQYQPPPQQAELDPRFVSKKQFDQLCQSQDNADWIKSTFEGLSPLLMEEIMRQDTSDLWTAFNLVMSQAREKKWQPRIYSNQQKQVLAYPIPLSFLKSTFDQKPAISIHEALEFVWREALRGKQFEAQKSTFEGLLKKVIEQSDHALRQVEQGLGESGRAAKHRRFGELLYAHLHDIQSGADSVTLIDFYSEKEITIPLDSKRSGPENAAHYFERAKHSEANQQMLQQRQEELKATLEDYRQTLERVQNATSTKELEAFRNAIPTLQQAGKSTFKKTQQPRFEGHRIKALASPDDYEVLVGENATSNDYLTRRLLRPNDLWLHARGATSAHAVIRCGKQSQQVPPATLQFAAREVIKRSAAKHAGYAAVDYTLGKYVRKPRKSAPGAVTYEREKTLHLTKDE